MGNSTSIGVFQRDVGWCETLDEMEGTRPGAAARNSSDFMEE